MKVMYVGLLYNYGKKEEGYSYEHHNLEAGFRECQRDGMFEEVIYLHPDATTEFQKSAMELIIEEEVDAIFHVAFDSNLDFPAKAAEMALKKGIPVIQWDCDASWRFTNFILPRKNRVSHFVTTHAATMPMYKAHGMNVIRSQWGGSPFYQNEPNAEKEYDITFIGQKHGQMPNGKFLRAEVIDRMLAAGLKVDLFGNYWDGYDSWHGYQTNFRKVVSAFNRSKICLNLSNPWHHGTMPQIKGRHFEIPQTGQFQLATPADDLHSYFKYDEEIVVANSVDEIIEKARYFLDHDDKRQAIADAGRERMLADHQWKHRFADIFGDIGLL